MIFRQSQGSGWRVRRWPAVLSVLVVALLTLGAVGLSSLLQPSEGSAERYPLRTVGNKVVDAQGQEVKITGVNWFGFETGTFAPHGLWARNYGQMLDEMRKSGFNTIRLPYSNELFQETSVPEGVDYSKNPELRGLKGVALMDKIVQGAEQRGLMVILDQHRPTSEGQSDLWHNEKVSEKQWLDDWTMLAKRYKNNKAVIGADLHNEPKNSATWGDGNPQTDWRLAAEKGGNAIHSVNPNWLILVEGIDKYKNDSYWWGGNLQGAKENPVRLNTPGKLVYSAHDYGPGVWGQNWFSAPDFPKNMPAIWDKQWGYLEKENIAPVLVGEFGGKSASPATVEGKWMNSLVDYMKANGVDYTYWSWNPNSGDTGGVVNEDWTTPNKEKLDLLKRYQAPQAPVPAPKP
jgi:endoglucanase